MTTMETKRATRRKILLIGGLFFAQIIIPGHGFSPASRTAFGNSMARPATMTAPRSSSLGGPLSFSMRSAPLNNHQYLQSHNICRDIKTRGPSFRLHLIHHPRTSTALSASKNDDNDSSPRLEKLKEEIVSKIPPKVLELMQVILEKAGQIFPTVRTALLGAFVGAVVTISAILIPVYNQVENLAEPVTLFETILGDLDQRYVDQVDTQKLFETGISAMLRSLDPYTEFEGRQQAVELNESIGGKYGGVGLVISGATPRDLALLEKSTSSSSSTTTVTPPSSKSSSILPDNAKEENRMLRENEDITSSDTAPPANSLALDEDDDDNDEEEMLSMQDRIDQRRALERAKDRGIRVVSAFEGYAFDYGMRVGDKLVAVDKTVISPGTSVEQVRNSLRGEPGTEVTIAFEREGVDGVQTVTMPRTVVKIRDVKLATFLGDPRDGIGYIQLTGFASDAGREVRSAIFALQRAAENASNGGHALQGLVLDLRGNPGGLLTSAVDVASLLVPKGSDIVSAKGRGFPGVLYRSRVDPILDPQKTKLAVLVNEGTASAAEIVSGAVQDLDVGVIVGSGRTFGKGLVQNVEDLPFETALKFTVAKYYTPSGRCIQGVNYSEGGLEEGGKYKATKVAKKDRSSYYTRLGREVKDGGGIEADFKVEAPKASALEVTLLRSGLFSDFAAKWSRENELTNSFDIDDDTYRQFQTFVNQKQKEGEIKLEALYSGAISDLKRALKASGYKGSGRELEQLQANIVREIQRDFDKYRSDIKEDLQQSILARYVPESMLIERSIKNDAQVAAAKKLVSNGRRFDSLLAQGSTVAEQKVETSVSSIATASSRVNDKPTPFLNIKW